MAARLQRLLNLRQGQKRQAEVQHRLARQEQARLESALMVPSSQAGACHPAAQLWWQDLLREQLLRQLPRQQQQVGSAQQALLQANIEQRQVEALMARQDLRRRALSARRESATLENWLRQRPTRAALRAGQAKEEGGW